MFRIHGIAPKRHGTRPLKGNCPSRFPHLAASNYNRQNEYLVPLVLVVEPAQASVELARRLEA